MIRLLPLLIGLAMLCAGAPARAQPQAAAPPALSAEQARAAIRVLNDPKQRAALTAALEAIGGTPAAQPAGPPASAKPAAPGEPAHAAMPLAPNSVGAQVLVGVEEFLSRTSARVVEAVQAARSLPQLWNWLVIVTTDPWARGFILDTAWRLAVALLLAAFADYALNRAVRRPVAVLESWAPAGNGSAAPAIDETGAEPETAPQAPPEPASETAEARAEAGETEAPAHLVPSALTMLRRLPLVLARLLLDLVPIVGFGLIGHLVAGSQIGGPRSSRLVLIAVIDSYVVCGAVLALARMMFSPGESRLRLFHIPDSHAAWLMRWFRRIVVLAVFGYAIAEVGSLLGLSDDARHGLLKTVSLVVHVCLAIMVLQKRRTIARLIRGRPDTAGPTARIRLALAAVFHWLAVVLIMAMWVVWAIEVPNGFSWLLRFIAVVGGLLIGARLLVIVATGLTDRALHEPLTQFPNLENRLRLYHPVINASLRAGVYLLTLLALLQLVGLHGLTWFAETDLGHRIVGAFATIAVTFLLAVAAWEAVNVSIDRHLEKLANEQQAVRSARLRTLLPLLRATLAITIVVFAGLTVLSEIGINIGPLLAGAGIVGVAIGFGSQKLVQDLINGIFLLLENAMQVGDWVTVSGLSGSVEALSIRTIRLRASDGSVHIIPFSSVTSVTNVNRGIGNAPISVVVDYAEDTDKVAAVLTEIVAGMRSEPEFAGRMLSDLQLWGVDKVDGAGATILGQVVCTDSGRWSVQREFNRRMKKRFEELGIRLFNPMRTIAVPPPAVQAAAPVEEHSHERSRAAE